MIYGYDFSILFTLRRVYRGQKSYGQSFHYFNPSYEFLKLYEMAR
ncbi:hypothetical protein E2C01_025030 [Portunus trituberculatus]|uniref:Uncharacterized protein n=1 Tax=Portunus trituberculatus TaxID=210409 RepID=A0A5B7EFG9_PORTR|nr:hypothetical protein [Portunus trituberculatus]